VAAGVCIRLYSEDDYLKRPEFTPPEIHRANLADVILRMKSARLGEIERFPFIDPPPLAAVRAGYQRRRRSCWSTASTSPRSPRRLAGWRRRRR
jgi:HrpA-like RNA helicase